MTTNYMAEARDPTIPPHAQQFLFAIDLVNYVMDTEWPKHDLKIKDLNGSENYREKVFKAFTSKTKEAIDFLITKEREAVKEKFSKYFENNKGITKESFHVLAKEYDYEFNSLGQIRGLMRYCVTLALLGGHYYSEGVTDGPDLAINHIFMKLPHEQFKDSSYWDEVDDCAKKILKEETDERDIAPNLNLDEYQEHNLQEENHPKLQL